MEEDAPIGPPAEILMRYSKPPQRLIDKAKSEIATLIDAAEVKKGMFSQPPWSNPETHS